MAGFTELDIEFYPLTPFFRKVLDYSSRYTISAYDASYVALADDLKIDVVTADKRLIGSTGKLGFVKWIGDFRP